MHCRCTLVEAISAMTLWKFVKTAYSFIREGIVPTSVPTYQKCYYNIVEWVDTTRAQSSQVIFMSARAISIANNVLVQFFILSRYLIDCTWPSLLFIRGARTSHRKYIGIPGSSHCAIAPVHYEECTLWCSGILLGWEIPPSCNVIKRYNVQWIIALCKK